MAFPKRLLADHEKLMADLRPHWIALVGPTLLTVAVIVGEILLLPRIPDSWPDWTRWAVIAIGVLLILFYAVRELLSWLTSHFVVTTDRVIHRSGWLAKSSMEIPLERLNDVTFRQSVLERIVGAGDLVIESGGEFGQNRFTDIRKPERVQKLIFEMSEANELRTRGGAAPDNESPVDRLERLSALKEKGAISAEEFEAQKRKLLGQI